MPDHVLDTSVFPSTKRCLSPNAGEPLSKRLGPLARSPAEAPRTSPHLPDEIWLRIVQKIATTPLQLLALRQVNRQLAGVSCDNTLWRPFVPELAPRPRDAGDNYALFAADTAKLPEVDRRAVARAWRKCGDMETFARYPEHFGVAQACVYREGSVLARMASRHRDDAHVAEVAIRSRPAIFQFVSARLRADIALLRCAIKLEPSLWYLAPKTLQTTSSFACDKAAWLMHSGRFSSARRAYTEVLRDHPNHPNAQYHLIACAFELSEFSLAHRLFVQQVEADSDFAQAHPELCFLLAPSAMERELSDAVIRFWPQICTAFFFAALNRRGASWPALLTFEDMRGVANGGYDLAARLGHALGIVGQTSFLNEAHAMADEAFAYALRFSPNESELRLLVGMHLLRKTHTQAAQRHLRHATQLTPTMLGAWSGLALSEARRGDLTNAKDAVYRGTALALGRSNQADIVARGLAAGICGPIVGTPAYAQAQFLLASLPCLEQAYYDVHAALGEAMPIYERAALLAAAHVWRGLHYMLR